MRFAFAALLLVACNPPRESVIDPDQDRDGYDSPYDCNDANPDISPAATELCNGYDDDCDDMVDEYGADADTWYLDEDGDGHGDPGQDEVSCDPLSGYALAGDDCDDADATVHTGANELCDGVDNDCDGETDEGASSGTWYVDADGDGYGDPARPVEGCPSGSGYSQWGTDCDDGDAATWPGATEVWYDGVDNGCDGTIDDGDADGDGYDWQGVGGADCDDGDDSVNPDATEICGDGVDNDCDGGGGSCGLSGDASPADADAILMGESDDDYAGYSVAVLGDTDGDGVGDLLVGAPYYTDSSGNTDGRAYLVEGPVDVDWGLGIADAILDGTDGAMLGLAVGAAGDVDGDGYADALVGAPYNDAVVASGGSAFLFSGPMTGTLTRSSSEARLWSTEADSLLGASVAGAGDLDDDGKDDVLLGTDHGSDSGAFDVAFLLYGDVTSMIYMTSADVTFTASAATSRVEVAGVGDMDGDGLPEVAIGAKGDGTTGSNAGAAFVFSGLPASGDLDLSDADGTWYGESALDRAGTSVAGAGDTDGDGYAELFIGADGDDSSGTDSGAAYLVQDLESVTLSASTAMAKLIAPAPCGTCSGYGKAGTDVSGAGDTDGDGYDDLLVGAPLFGYAASSDGVAWLVPGPVTSLRLLDSTASATIIGEDAFQRAGWSVAGGDLNDDGLSDIVVGAIYDDRGGNQAGAAFVFLGGGL